MLLSTISVVVYALLLRPNLKGRPWFCKAQVHWGSVVHEYKQISVGDAVEPQLYVHD